MFTGSSSPFLCSLQIASLLPLARSIEMLRRVIATALRGRQAGQRTGPWCTRPVVSIGSDERKRNVACVREQKCLFLLFTRPLTLLLKQYSQSQGQSYVHFPLYTENLSEGQHTTPSPTPLQLLVRTSFPCACLDSTSLEAALERAQQAVWHSCVWATTTRTVEEHPQATTGNWAVISSQRQQFHWVKCPLMCDGFAVVWYAHFLSVWD